MIMRYLYGLGVGHTYARGCAQRIFNQPAAGQSQEQERSDDEHVPLDPDDASKLMHESLNTSDDSSDSDGSSSSNNLTDDEAYAMEEMYG
jgi:hypothetical protein